MKKILPEIWQTIGKPLVASLLRLLANKVSKRKKKSANGTALDEPGNSDAGETAAAN